MTAVVQESRIAIRRVTGDPVRRWLVAGWHDLWRSPAASLSPGLLCTLASYLVLDVTVRAGAFIILFPLLGGFLFVAPLMAIGLYEISRRHERQQPVGGLMIWAAVRHNPARLAAMGVLLALLLGAWVWLAQLLFTVCFGSDPYADLMFQGFAGYPTVPFLLLSNAVGAICAAIAFMSSVVALPMLLDRDIGVGTAITTSWRACLDNPLVMTRWAVALALLTAIGVATFFLGLIIVLPLLGHATWHAYRDVVLPDTNAP